jgi:hypothetical protein
MCQHFLILAECGDTRSIAQCEHTTIHLLWDVVTIRLSRDALLRLAMVLERWALQPDTTITQGSAIQLFTAADGSVHLWITAAGLYLSAHDAAQFATLVCDAARMLATAATAPPSPLSESYCPMQITEPHSHAGN